MCTSTHMKDQSCLPVRSGAELISLGIKSLARAQTFRTCCFPTLANSYRSLSNSSFPFDSAIEPFPLFRGTSSSKVCKSMLFSMLYGYVFLDPLVLEVYVNENSSLVESTSRKASRQIGNKKGQHNEGDRDTGHMQCKSILIFIASRGNVSHVRQ